MTACRSIGIALGFHSRDRTFHSLSKWRKVLNLRHLPCDNRVAKQNQSSIGFWRRRQSSLEMLLYELYPLSLSSIWSSHGGPQRRSRNQFFNCVSSHQPSEGESHTTEFLPVGLFPGFGRQNPNRVWPSSGPVMISVSQVQHIRRNPSDSPGVPGMSARTAAVAATVSVKP